MERRAQDLAVGLVGKAARQTAHDAHHKAYVAVVGVAGGLLVSAMEVKDHINARLALAALGRLRDWKPGDKGGFSDVRIAIYACGCPLKTRRCRLDILDPAMRAIETAFPAEELESTRRWAHETMYNEVVGSQVNESDGWSIVKRMLDGQLHTSARWDLRVRDEKMDALIKKVPDGEPTNRGRSSVSGEGFISTDQILSIRDADGNQVTLFKP